MEKTFNIQRSTSNKRKAENHEIREPREIERTTNYLSTDSHRWTESGHEKEDGRWKIEDGKWKKFNITKW